MSKCDSWAANKITNYFDFSLSGRNEVLRLADDNLLINFDKIDADHLNNNSSIQHKTTDPGDLTSEQNSHAMSDIMFDPNEVNLSVDEAQITNPHFVLISDEIPIQNGQPESDVLAEAILSSMAPTNRTEMTALGTYDKETFQREANERLIEFNAKFTQESITEEPCGDDFSLPGDLDMGADMMDWEEEIAWMSFDDILNGTEKLEDVDCDNLGDSLETISPTSANEVYYGYPEVTSSISPMTNDNQKYKGRRVHYHVRHQANKRERNRMGIINKAFEKLRRNVPTYSVERKLSKVETLRAAMDYIQFLSNLLESPQAKNKTKPKEKVVIKKDIPAESSLSTNVIGYSISWAWREGCKPIRDDFGGEFSNNFPAEGNKVKKIKAPLWLPGVEENVDIYHKVYSTVRTDPQCETIPLKYINKHGSCFNVTGKINLMPYDNIPPQPFVQVEAPIIPQQQTGDFYVHAITDLLAQSEQCDAETQDYGLSNTLQSLLCSRPEPLVTCPKHIDVKSKLSGYIQSRIKTKLDNLPKII